MRNITIDIAKGIGILTVVLCHNWILYHEQGDLSRVVFSFHMPLFFFISGIFFKPQLSFFETFKSKAHGLLKPYFFIVTLLTAFTFIKDFIHPSDINNINELLKVLYGASPTLSWVQLWFLTHLFTIFIFAWFLEKHFLSKIKNRLGYAIALILLFLIGVSTIKLFWGVPIDPFGINQNVFREGFASSQQTHDGQSILFGLPYNLDLLLVTTPMFLFGHFLSEKVKTFEFNFLWFFVSLFIFAFLHIQFDFTMALHMREYDNTLITSAEMITGIYLTLAISALLSHVNVIKEVLAYLGKASLFILIFHFSVQHYVTGAFRYYFPEYEYTASSIGFFVSIVVSLIIYAIVNRTPWLQPFFMYIPKKKQLK